MENRLRSQRRPHPATEPLSTEEVIGLLVDREEDFLPAVRRLLTDAVLRERMARAARAHARRFSWAAKFGSRRQL